ncbi:lysine requiring protein [Yamadazyma tenuis]|nr:lysine requiring protein [Yamadazyma tenuis]
MSHPSPASKASVSGSTSGPDHSNAPEPEIPVKSDMLFDNYFNKEDLNLLASDLNNLVGSIMVESNFEIGDDFDMMSSESSSSIMNHISPPSIPIMRSIYSNNSHLEQNTIPRNLPYDYIKVKYPHERYYLEQFYTNFATLILPFNPYQESVGGYYNPSRDVVLFCASKEPFLLAAILAQGAKEAYNSTGLANHEEAYCSYLSKCLKLLGPALNEDPSASDKKSGLQHRRQHTSNIESVLITVLLLTSANASNTKQNWRPHLKGAKDLLLKYSMHSDLKESKLLIFCKTWFISFELLAGLSSAKGGTLQTDAELDSIMKLDDNDDLTILREIGLLSDSGFNYMFGFAHSLLPSIKELIKFMNVARDSAVTTNPTVSSNGAVATPKFPLNTIRMLSEFYQSTKISFVNKKFYLSPDDFFGGSVPNGCLLDVQQVNGKTIVINWMDISHHAYCLGGILSVLTKGFGLSYDDDQVKPVTDQLVGLMKILSDIPMPNFTRWRPLMIQWPMFICGLNCYDEDQMNIVKQFFRISEAGSATFSIRIIDKIWNKHKNNITDESDVDIDLVTY